MPENSFFMPIFNPSSTTDRHCGTQYMQILLNLWLVYIRESSMQFSYKKKSNYIYTQKLTISDYTFLSILPLK